MTSSSEHEQRAGVDWERIGRAAEHFARRVARDARTFAAHLEAHAGELAREVWRDGACGRGHRHHRRERPAPDVRQMFEDVRGVLAGIMDGIDDLLASAFPAAADEPWRRVVSNRDAACTGCGAALAAGAEAHARRTAAGTEFRCLACGVPDPGTA
jgi:hypothetical protein